MNVEARWFPGLADRTVHLPRAAPEWRREEILDFQPDGVEGLSKAVHIGKERKTAQLFFPRDPYIAAEV